MSTIRPMFFQTTFEVHANIYILHVREEFVVVDLAKIKSFYTYYSAACFFPAYNTEISIRSKMLMLQKSNNMQSWVNYQVEVAKKLISKAEERMTHVMQPQDI